MADNTKNLHRQVELHEERFQRIEKILDQLTNMVRKEPNKGEWDQNQIRGGFPRGGIRLDVLHFSGENSIAWVFKATQYFDLYQTLPPQCLLMVFYHMERDTLVWYQDAMESGQFSSWEAFVRAFVRALLLRFGPTVYDDLMEALTHPKQQQ